MYLLTRFQVKSLHQSFRYFFLSIFKLHCLQTMTHLVFHFNMFFSGLSSKTIGSWESRSCPKTRRNCSQRRKAIGTNSKSSARYCWGTITNAMLQEQLIIFHKLMILWLSSSCHELSFISWKRNFILIESFNYKHLW